MNEVLQYVQNIESSYSLPHKTLDQRTRTKAKSKYDKGKGGNSRNTTNSVIADPNCTLPRKGLTLIGAGL